MTHGSPLAQIETLSKALKESSATIKSKAAAVEVAEQKATEVESDAEKWRRLKIGLFSASPLMLRCWRMARFGTVKGGARHHLPR